MSLKDKLAKHSTSLLIIGAVLFLGFIASGTGVKKAEAVENICTNVSEGTTGLLDGYVTSKNGLEGGKIMITFTTRSGCDISLAVKASEDYLFQVGRGIKFEATNSQSYWKPNIKTLEVAPGATFNSSSDGTDIQLSKVLVTINEAPQEIGTNSEYLIIPVPMGDIGGYVNLVILRNNAKGIQIGHHYEFYYDSSNRITMLNEIQ